MPARTKKQWKYIWYLRNKNKNKKRVPEKDKWAMKPEWTAGVDYKELPQAAEQFITKFEDFVNEKNNEE
jgi:hypothetical protein